MATRHRLADRELGMHLRRMRADDIPQISALDQLCKLTPWNKENYRRLLNQEGIFAYVLMEQARLAGFVIGRVIVPEAEIYKIAVSPACQRRGLGQRLLRASIKLAADQHCDCCYLEVRESNRVARVFYEAAGFRVIGRRCGYYSHPDEDAIVMVANIGSVP